MQNPIKHPLFAAGTLLLLLMPATKITAQTKNAEHIVVHHEEGKFLGWPANNGAWTAG
jgi:hypothetical protein